MIMRNQLNNIMMEYNIEEEVSEFIWNQDEQEAELELDQLDRRGA